MATHLLGAFYALFAAALYGGADFSGGFATRRLHHYQVLMLTALVGAVVMFVLTILWGEGLPSTTSIFYAVLASVSGSIGLATLYQALAYRRASIVAPASAVVASAVPVIYSAILQGLPANITLAGFILAAFGIWMTTRSEPVEGEIANDGLLQGVFSGLAFGGFFIFLARIEPGYIFSPQNQGGDDLRDSDPDPATGRTEVFPLTANQIDDSRDAGFIQFAGVGDFAWHDLNRNGIQDNGESGLIDVIVNLYDYGDVLLGTSITTSAGMYSFTDVIPGDYYLEITLPACHSFSPQDQGTNRIGSNAPPTIL